MSTRASLTDLARLREHNYAVVPFTGRGGGFMLLDRNDPVDPDGDPLMIGEHGCIAPTRWEAVAEGLKRIDSDYPAITLEGSLAVALAQQQHFEALAEGLHETYCATADGDGASQTREAATAAAKVAAAYEQAATALKALLAVERETEAGVA